MSKSLEMVQGYHLGLFYTTDPKVYSKLHLSPPASLAPQYMQAQVQQPPVLQQVVALQVID